MKTNIQKIISWGFYLFVFLLPWQTRWIVKPGELNGGVWEYGSFSLYAPDIIFLAVLLLFIFWKVDQVITPVKIKLSKISFSLIALLAIALLSTFWASSQPLAWYNFFKLAEGLALVWLLSVGNFSARNTVLALVMGAVVQSFLAIWQFLGQMTFASKWLGLALQVPGNLGVSVIETASERWLRAYGALPHPNILAGLLVISLLLLVSLAFSAKEPYQKLFVLFSWAVMATALFFTFSRGAFLGLLAGLFFYGLIAVRSKDKVIRKRLTILFLLLIIIFSSLAIIFKEPFIARTGGGERLEIKSINERLTYYQQAGQLIRKNWYRGIGIGNYTLAVKEQVEKNLKSYDYQPVHNVYFLILCELSIFGLIIFLYFVFQLLYANRHSPLLPALVAILVIMLFDHYFWTLNFGVMLFWLLVALLIRKIK